MANQSVPNQQTTSYTKNGFRTDVNKVTMPYGHGVPLQPIYNFILSPVLDSGNGSICAPQVFPGANTPLTLNQNPSLESATQVVTTGVALTNTPTGNFVVGTAITVTQDANNFVPKKIPFQFTTASGTTPSITLAVTGFIAPGVKKTENVLITNTAAVPTQYAYYSLQSVVVTAIAGSTPVFSGYVAPTASIPQNTITSSALLTSAVTLTNPPAVGTSLPLSTSAAQFPSQIVTFNITLAPNATTAQTLKAVVLTVNGTAIAVGDIVGDTALSVTKVVVTAAAITSIQTAVLSYTAAASTTAAVVEIEATVGLFDTSVMYKTINGQNMSQMDSQRCVEIALTKTTIGSGNSSLCQVLITGYDNRFVQVQETLTLPLTALTQNVAVYFTSNKAYAYVQSVILNATPGTGINISVSASNQFFGLPFYYSSDAVMTIVEPFLSGPDSGYITPSVQGGNNFYSTVPNALKSLSLNTWTGLPGPTSTISTLDARGLIALDQEITNSEDIITYVAYIYAADSFINAQLQNVDANPLAQQQLSNWITGTQGATVNDTTTWTKTNWATTALLDFDLTGAQFPGDQSQFNEIFNNQNLPTTATRFMGSALTAPSVV